MRLVTTRGKPALLGYCTNVHAGETLEDVEEMLRRFAGPIRRALGVSELGLGLWLSRGALDQVRRAGVGRLREALRAQGLFVFTLNGFPYGNFHSEVVKRAVYHPDWSTRDRRRYVLELAEALAALLPDNVGEGTISTLPIAHRQEAAGDGELWERALGELCALAEDLARLWETTGKSIRVCLEPEPGCFLETTAQAIRFFRESLPEAARRHKVDRALLDQHLGVCFDTCHQAVAFEEAAAALESLRQADVVVGKIQLASALVVGDPASVAGRSALARFDEPRFLHQVRVRLDDGGLASADDLPEALGGTGDMALPSDRPWRVHFHIPIHRQVVGELGQLGTTRSFVTEALATVGGWDPVPHLEVETYTWSVLPPGDRPAGDDGLVAGIAAELSWVKEQIA
jgi:sugar phosphate isomerase/epimerase